MVTSDEDTASFTTDSSGQGSTTFGVAVSGWTRPGDGFRYFTTSVTRAANNVAHCGNVGILMRMAILVETDSRSRVVLPGHPDERFLVHENADGSLLLQPAVVITEAQHEYDSNPELRDLLARASASPTVRRSRARHSG